MKLKVNEIYKSIQGESTYMGLPCTFIRLTYCNLRCSYCDTEYAFYEGVNMRIDEIIAKVNRNNCYLPYGARASSNRPPIKRPAPRVIFKPWSSLKFSFNMVGFIL